MFDDMYNPVEFRQYQHWTDGLNW